METQPSSWLDQKVQEIVDELTCGDPDPPIDLAVAATFMRYAYGMGYMLGLQDRMDQ